MKGLAIAWIIISFTDIIYTAYKAGQKYQRQIELSDIWSSLLISGITIILCGRVLGWW